MQKKKKLVKDTAPVNFFKRIKLSGDVIGLILWNLFPLAGVLLFGWKPEAAFTCYALECIVVGVFNVFRLLTIVFLGPSQWLLSILKGIFFIPFFIVLYFGGLYTLLTAFFLIKDGLGVSIFYVFYVIRDLLYQPSYNVALGACILNTAYSFINGFLRNRIYATRSMFDQMPVPTPRLLLLMGVILPSMVLVQITGGSLVILILFVAFKLLMELILRNSQSYGATMERMEMTGDQNKLPLI